MNFKHIILFIILFTLLPACGTSFGKKKVFGNLEVFYSESVSEKYAIEVGDYFVENDLVQDNPHSIKLTSNHNSFILKLILDSKYKSLPKDKEIAFIALESDIKKSIFKEMNFKLEICDVNFYPLNLKN